MCGIFAYLNYLTPKTRKEVLDFLITGLERLEYRGYDSAGVGIDGDANNIVLIKKKGKVAMLKKEIYDSDGKEGVTFERELNNHVGISHTRWATHGVPSEVNSHPQRSGDDNKFVVVHNGIITNHRDIKEYLLKHGCSAFESDTDTEVIAKLVNLLHEQNPHDTFRHLVEKAISQLEGAFACAFKSKVYPGEVVATRRGSPLLVGIKTEHGLDADSIPVQYR